MGVLRRERISFLPVIGNLNLFLHHFMFNIVSFNDLLSDDLLTWLNNHLLLVAFGNEHFLLNNMTYLFWLIIRFELFVDHGYNNTKNAADNKSYDNTAISSSSS
jgi:hypothetical protein